MGVAAITPPAGKVSISGAVRVAATRLGLLKTMVSVETPPSAMLIGMKPLASVGAAGGGTAVRVAVTGAALFPLLVCKTPARSVLS